MLIQPIGKEAIVLAHGLERGQQEQQDMMRLLALHTQQGIM
jgi:hypothetical protein